MLGFICSRTNIKSIDESVVNSFFKPKVTMGYTGGFIKVALKQCIM